MNFWSYSSKVIQWLCRIYWINLQSLAHHYKGSSRSDFVFAYMVSLYPLYTLCFILQNLTPCTSLNKTRFLPRIWPFRLATLSPGSAFSHITATGKLFTVTSKFQLKHDSPLHSQAIPMFLRVAPTVYVHTSFKACITYYPSVYIVVHPPLDCEKLSLLWNPSAQQWSHIVGILQNEWTKWWINGQMNG